MCIFALSLPFLFVLFIITKFFHNIYSLYNLYNHESTDEVTVEEYIIDKIKEELIKEPIETFIKNHLLIFQSLPSSDEISDCRINLELSLVDDDEISDCREWCRDQFKQNN